MNKVTFFLKCTLVAAAVFALLGYVVMLLWNWLIPDLFHGPSIGYWQALGLFVLSKILFWSGGKKYSSDCQPGDAGSAPYWKHRFYEKFSSMSEQDRTVFKQKMKEKWCNWEKGQQQPPNTND